MYLHEPYLCFVRWFALRGEIAWCVAALHMPGHPFSVYKLSHFMHSKLPMVPFLSGARQSVTKSSATIWLPIAPLTTCSAFSSSLEQNVQLTAWKAKFFQVDMVKVHRQVSRCVHGQGIGSSRSCGIMEPWQLPSIEVR